MLVVVFFFFRALVYGWVSSFEPTQLPDELTRLHFCYCEYTAVSRESDFKKRTNEKKRRGWVWNLGMTVRLISGDTPKTSVHSFSVADKAFATLAKRRWY